MFRRRSKQLGVWRRVQAFGKCDFIAYHGTYELRARKIRKEGLKVPPSGGIWITRSPRYAHYHAAKRAVMEGCPDEPIVVLRVRVKGTKDSCPVYRPLRAKGLPEFYYTDAPIPKSRVLGKELYRPGAVEAGRRSGFERLKKEKKPRPKRCPPPGPFD
jgi:hypothetical protein